MRPANPGVTGLWLVHQGELVGLPVELSRVDDDAADAGAVPAQPLGEGVNHDVGPVLDRALQVGCCEGAVDDEWQSVGMCDVGDGLDISHLQAGVADGFAEEQLGLGGDGLGKVFRIVGIYKVSLDSELWKDVVKLGEGSTVQVIRGHDFIARLAEVDDRVEDSACAGP